MKRIIISTLVLAMMSCYIGGSATADDAKKTDKAKETDASKIEAKDVTVTSDSDIKSKGAGGLKLQAVPGGFLASFRPKSKTLNSNCSASCDNGHSYYNWTCPTGYPYCGIDCTKSPVYKWCYR